MLILKFDFEKAFDSISSDYLDQIMVFMGFGDRWRLWIRGMFKNARSSVLLKGIPSDEFQLFIGLREGYPLSPFLFNIVMEGLHVTMENVVVEGAFRGVPLEMGDFHISYFFMQMMLYFWVSGVRETFVISFVLFDFLVRSVFKIDWLWA